MLKRMGIQSIVKTIMQFDVEVIGPPLLSAVVGRGELRLFVVCNQDDSIAHDAPRFMTPFAYPEENCVPTQTTRMCFDEVHVAQGLKSDGSHIATRLLFSKAS